ncbi:hypothetical protein [Sulfurospirillum sp. UCH001]|uniref:hypothetical protein n=1 Tax=Sulfurospirillum sp. UCH001 TaxID=1581011 RepID=UPI0008376468|nr:hypothetical protein [Sulfurospirillum sp. UCH001]
MFAIALTAIKTFLGNQLNTLSYILIAALIASLGWSASLKMDVWSLERNLSTCKDENGYLLTDKARYENAIAIGQKQQEEKIVYVDKEVEKIKWKTEIKIKTIKEYVKDENLTDCQNAMAFARSFF